MAGVDQVWASAAIKFCLENGIDSFFLAPGSRCTPLTLAVARESGAQVVQHFDERGLAFAALGYGRATGKPGVFICTSGTAVANAFPAVIEAAMESVPMLLFTADRPTELRGTGANQTIDQQNIFGNYPNLFLDLPVPNEKEDSVLGDALSRSVAEAANGPVHVNWMFREPFTIADCASSGIPSPKLQQGELVPQVSVNLDDAAGCEVVNLDGNVLVALGGCKPSEAHQALELSKRLNCPLISDITSGLRVGSFELPTEFDLPQPDTILHLGGRMVSKSWHRWTAQLGDKGVRFVHVSPNGQNINPNHLPVEQVRTSLANLDSKIVGPACDEAFRESWSNAWTKRDAVVESRLADANELSEPAVAFFLSKNCPTDEGLFVGNSTPIRDLDWYGGGSVDVPRNVAANRGASGIDGLMATAVGYAVGLKKRTTVVLGDLSALHDLNSLALIAKSKWPIVLVVINNQGGHIFDLLSIRESKHFEAFFATPHEYRFEHAAKMFGIDYHNITEMSDMVRQYQTACSGNRSVILELMTDRQTNVRVRNEIREEIQKCSNRS